MIVEQQDCLSLAHWKTSRGMTYVPWGTYSVDFAGLYEAVWSVAETLEPILRHERFAHDEMGVVASCRDYNSTLYWPPAS